MAVIPQTGLSLPVRTDAPVVGQWKPFLSKIGTPQVTQPQLTPAQLEQAKANEINKYNEQKLLRSQEAALQAAPTIVQKTPIGGVVRRNAAVATPVAGVTGAFFTDGSMQNITYRGQVYPREAFFGKFLGAGQQLAQRTTPQAAQTMTETVTKPTPTVINRTPSVTEQMQKMTEGRKAANVAAPTPTVQPMSNSFSRMMQPSTTEYQRRYAPASTSTGSEPTSRSTGGSTTNRY